MIGFHPPPYRVPKLHPQRYYKTGNHAESASQLEKDQIGLESEKDPYPWLDFRRSKKRYE